LLSIKITSPATLTTVGSLRLAIAGTISDPDAALYVNGEPVVHSNGLFSANVALEEGRILFWQELLLLMVQKLWIQSLLHYTQLPVYYHRISC